MPLCRWITFLPLSLAKASGSWMYCFSKSLSAAIQLSIVNLAVSFLLMNPLSLRYLAAPRFDSVICFGLQGQDGQNGMERTNSWLSPKRRWCPPLCVLTHSPLCDEGRAGPSPCPASMVPFSQSQGGNAGRELPCHDPFPEYFLCFRQFVD